MHTGAVTNTGAFSSADANTDASISNCAYVDTNSCAYSSTDSRDYSTVVSPYASTKSPAQAPSPAYQAADHPTAAHRRQKQRWRSCQRRLQHPRQQQRLR